MASDNVTVEVWVLVDENGNYVAHEDADSIKDRYESDVGELSPTTATRVVRLTLTVPKPLAVELTATIAAEPESGELRAA